MDMNKAFFFKNESIINPNWRLIDAQGQIVGRLATHIADALRGKDKAIYTPHSDAGDYVVVINAEKVVFTGNKMIEKEYVWYTGWIGGQKRRTPAEYLKRDPEFILMHAIKGMLPKNKQSRQMLRKLKIYAGNQHPHQAQITTSAQNEAAKSA